MTTQTNLCKPNRAGRNTTRRTTQYFHHIPRVNVTRSEDAIELALAIPGVNKDKISIRVENDHLHISDNSETSNRIYATKGFDLTGFNRSFALSKDVDANQIKATVNDGILNLTLPIKEAAKPRTISIS